MSQIRVQLLPRARVKPKGLTVRPERLLAKAIWGKTLVEKLGTAKVVVSGKVSARTAANLAMDRETVGRNRKMKDIIRGRRK